MSYNPYKIENFLRELLMQHNTNNIKAIELLPLFQDETGRASQRISVVVKYANDSEDLCLFLKVCPADNEIVSFLNDTLSLFEKETTFYANMLPKLIEFERKFKCTKNDGESLQTYFLKFFGSGYVEKDFFIVLEQFNSNDYYVSEKLDFHNNDKIKNVMQSLAVFHATSYCMKFLLNAELFKEFPILVDKLFHPKDHAIIGPFFIQNFKAHIKVLKSVLKEMHAGSFEFEDYSNVDENILLKLEHLSDCIMTVLHQVQQCDEKYKVICHGDCHLWNIALNKNPENTDVKYFDFQLVRYTSGLIDVQHYLSQVTTPNIRKSFIKDFLGFYYEKFNEVCMGYNLPAEKNITYTEMENEYNRTCLWQFIYGFVFILPRFVGQDFYSKLSVVKKDCDVINLILEQKDSNSTLAMIKTYFEIVAEAEANGTLANMELMAESVGN